jgi:hypothetical protein
MVKMINIDSNDENIIVSGNTNKIKRKIKKLGGVWSDENPGWIVPLDKKKKLYKIVRKHFVEERQKKEDETVEEYEDNETYILNSEDKPLNIFISVMFYLSTFYLMYLVC